jgi:hypothetical protein
MEDVLDLYNDPYDEHRPVICFDESSKALRGHGSGSLPANRERSHGSITATNATGKNEPTSPRNR